MRFTFPKSEYVAKTIQNPVWDKKQSTTLDENVDHSEILTFVCNFARCFI